MAPAAPEWLTRHGGSLLRGSDGRTSLVMFNNQPLYALVTVPVGGGFGCAVTQTNNGSRIESTSKAATPEDACRAGLEDLRKALGW